MPASHSNNFTFLRLLLAILVLLSHSFELMDGNRSREILTNIFHTISFGELAVDGFFLLSGYLIVQSWQRQPHLLPFLRNRVLRIYPAFIVATLISALIVGPLGANPADYFHNFQLWPFLKGMLLLQTPAVPTVFIGSPYPDVNGSMWTIVYEFFCYLLVPLAALCGRAKHKYMWVMLFLFMIAVSAWQPLTKLLASGLFINVGLRLFLFFFAGGCFFLFREYIPYRKEGVILSLIIVFIGLHYRNFVDPILLIFGAYIFFSAAFTPAPFLRRLDRWGDISYGVYLYGWPIQKLLIWYKISSSPWWIFILSCLGSAVAGALSWYFIERQFLRLKSYPLPVPIV